MSGTAGALAAEANTIFDILNLSFGGRGKPPSPESTHRYYLCQKPDFDSRMTCEQVTYDRVLRFFHEKETAPTKAAMVPIEKITPKLLDQPILSYKLWTPVTITPSK